MEAKAGNGTVTESYSMRKHEGECLRMKRIPVWILLGLMVASAALVGVTTNMPVSAEAAGSGTDLPALPPVEKPADPAKDAAQQPGTATDAGKEPLPVIDEAKTPGDAAMQGAMDLPVVDDSNLPIEKAMDGYTVDVSQIKQSEIVKGELVEEGKNARINWTSDYIEATGQAVPPTGKQGTGQGQLLARRGATLDLQRNLLEFIKGVQLSSETRMDDFMVANDTVRTQVQGMIKNVEITDAKFDGEIYTVTGRIKLDKVRQSVLPHLPKPSDATPGKSSGKYGYTGLILDCRGLPLIPAMTFRILDQRGKVVYGPGIAEDEVLLNSGQCEYHTNMEWAKGSAKVADRPLIVKPAKLVGPNNVDIVVSNAAADKMRNSKMNFLAKCRVLVVKR